MGSKPRGFPKAAPVLCHLIEGDLQLGGTGIASPILKLETRELGSSCVPPTPATSASGDGDARALGTWPGPFASVPGAHLPHQRRPLSRLRSWQPRLRPAFSFPGTSVAQSPGPSGAAARAPRLCSHLPPPCPAGGPPGVATCVESARPSASWVRLRDWPERSWLSRPWLPAWGSPGWRNPRPARASFASVRPGLSAGHSAQGPRISVC